MEEDNGNLFPSLGIIFIKETLAALVEPNSEIAFPKVVPQNEAVGQNMVATGSSGLN